MRWQIWTVLAIAGCRGGDGGPYFSEEMFFNADASSARVAKDSGSQIAGLRAAGGWGRSDRFSVDFSMEVLEATDATPMKMFTPTTDHFYVPDCDLQPMPVPASGQIEGEEGYECKKGGDCHLIVHDAANGKLYEMWKANMIDAYFTGGCLAIWDTGHAYGASLRGDQCSSADGAGFPIAPLLFTADEVAAGEINHAIRFVLPNDRIRRAFVRPATHATETTGPANAPAYGVHLRLKASFDVESLPSEGAKVVARAMQKYGMYHADGGEWALTAQSDRYTTAKWPGLLHEDDLAALQVEDFEVIDHGPPIKLNYKCER